MTSISGLRASVSSAHLAATRAAWHSVAEHVLAATRYAATGHIGRLGEEGASNGAWAIAQARQRTARQDPLAVAGSGQAPGHRS